MTEVKRAHIEKTWKSYTAEIIPTSKILLSGIYQNLWTTPFVPVINRPLQVSWFFKSTLLFFRYKRKFYNVCVYLYSLQGCFYWQCYTEVSLQDRLAQVTVLLNICRFHTFQAPSPSDTLPKQWLIPGCFLFKIATGVSCFQ